MVAFLCDVISSCLRFQDNLAIDAWMWKEAQKTENWIFAWQQSNFSSALLYTDKPYLFILLRLTWWDECISLLTPHPHISRAKQKSRKVLSFKRPPEIFFQSGLTLSQTLLHILKELINIFSFVHSISPMRFTLNGIVATHCIF